MFSTIPDADGMPAAQLDHIGKGGPLGTFSVCVDRRLDHRNGLQPSCGQRGQAQGPAAFGSGWSASTGRSAASVFLTGWRRWARRMLLHRGMTAFGRSWSPAPRRTNSRGQAGVAPMTRRGIVPESRGLYLIGGSGVTPSRVPWPRTRRRPSWPAGSPGACAGVPRRSSPARWRPGRGDAR